MRFPGARWFTRDSVRAAAQRAGRTADFADPRIAAQPSQDLRELLDELFGHVRQLRADVNGLLNANKDMWARLHEVQYQPDSKYVAWTKAAKDMADVEPEDDGHGTGD